ncbi:DUF5071 domain-containing protein [Tamlana sp. 2201CG12-4]|uniref:DUF5071 domain-containing protein n=1 Tax=Tamlana sp. 2201CG12-4 TaxID=3112582 RepID=UPI002DBF0173|nr:DUF5071 domain-containing protein [Tamlana sp. 2201CG12-4]MEC3908455.1 DUF5071 domain-containing protein [Tamlana sp. 2201CG12-4]
MSQKMDIYSLIPSDKFDIERAEKLKEFSFEKIKPIVPDLLEWIQDMNWPVAKVVADYLISISDKIEPEIMDILNGEDDIWKYWCIEVFCIYSDRPMSANMSTIVNRIKNNPTKLEKECEVYDQAVRALSKQ